MPPPRTAPIPPSYAVRLAAAKLGNVILKAPAEDEIARFIAEKGVTKLPDSRTVMASDPVDAVAWNPTKRKWVRARQHG